MCFLPRSRLVCPLVPLALIGLLAGLAGCAARSGEASPARAAAPEAAPHATQSAMSAVPHPAQPAASAAARPAARLPASKPAARLIPTRYDEDRFLAEPVTARGHERLNIYLDTGGNNLLYADVVRRLGLEPVKRSHGKHSWREVHLPAFAPQASIPAPLTRNGRVLVIARGPHDDGWSGMLGPEWFAGRCWLFDYPGHRLELLDHCGAAPEPEHTAQLGFKRGLFFPRIQAEIDGEKLDLLFDTGAQTHLTPAAEQELHDGHAATRATSFITRSIFERWHARHPAWRVIEHAERRSGEAMIRVPKLSIAGYEVGPVWFTRRPDPNFHQFMSRWMDRPIDGALGGDALRSFRIVVDYQRKIARFERG